MEIGIELAADEDVDELGTMYNELVNYLEQTKNYPGWKKGVYPTKDTAIEGIQNKNLYVAKKDGAIIGTIILSHLPEPAYEGADWAFFSDYSDVIVIHTFAVHPAYLKRGVGRQMIAFAIQYAKDLHMKAIRLDVYENNSPAIRLYESYGFQYIDTVDLGWGAYGLDWYKLYEKIL